MPLLPQPTCERPATDSKPRGDGRPNSRRHLLEFCGILSAIALLAVGCAGYTLGPSNGSEAGSRSIQVNLFANKTLEPRLAEPVAHALRKQLQQDGTFRLATRDDADVIVDGTLLRYERDPLSFNPADIVATRDYEARLTARVRAVDRGNGRVLIDREIQGKTLIQGQKDLPSAERQSAPLLAEDLARSITALLVDGKW